MAPCWRTPTSRLPIWITLDNRPTARIAREILPRIRLHLNLKVLLKFQKPSTFRNWPGSTRIPVTPALKRQRNKMGSYPSLPQQTAFSSLRQQILTMSPHRPLNGRTQPLGFASLPYRQRKITREEVMR